MNKKKNETLQRATLSKLGIDPIALAQAPPLTMILDCVEGGIPAVIAAMRFSGDPAVQDFLAVYDKALIQEREILPIEAFALLADVSMTQLLGAAMLAVQNVSANMVKMVTMSAHPDLARVSVQEARKPECFQERKMLHTALRFLPVSNHTTLLVRMPAETGGGDATVDPEEVDANDIFPSLMETQKLLGRGE